MEQEHDYLEALKSATSYRINGSTLNMTNASGEVILVFTALNLENTSWKLDSYVNNAGNLVNVLPDTDITAEFQDGEIGGNSGCNNYFGTYEISGCNEIIMGPFNVTLMFCSVPAGIMKQEQDYLAALESAAHYSINGNTLVITNAAGEVILVFIAA